MFITLGNPEVTAGNLFLFFSILLLNRAEQTISSRQFIHLM